MSVGWIRYSGNERNWVGDESDSEAEEKEKGDFDCCDCVVEDRITAEREFFRRGFRRRLRALGRCGQIYLLRLFGQSSHCAFTNCGGLFKLCSIMLNVLLVTVQIANNAFFVK